MSDFVLMNRQPQRANALLTKRQWTSLCLHLHNGNDAHGFVMGFRKDGAKKYTRSKNLPVDRAISWAWSTIEGKSKPGRELAFVPYSTDSERKSRWAGMDFDAHHGDAERARKFAFAAFQHLLESELFVILETSGSGGWHVWIVAKEFRPVERWIKFLKQIAAAIGAPVQAGICEIFPPDTTSNGFGKGMRAPGCWNPSTETFSEILYENVEPLISSLSLNCPPPLSVSLMKQKEVIFLSSSLYLQWRKQWAVEFAISAPDTRNEKLCSLVGTIFHQVGKETARRLAEAQYNEATVKPKASLPDHLKNFEELWAGMETQWLADLNESERLKLPTLPSERDAFRIIRNFHRLALKKSREDFPLAVANLGDRLGMTAMGGSKLRQRLVEAGTIKPTEPCRPNKTAARFKWMPCNLKQSQPAEDIVATAKRMFSATVIYGDENF